MPTLLILLLALLLNAAPATGQQLSDQSDTLGDMPPPGAVVKKIEFVPEAGENLRGLVEIEVGERFRAEALRVSLKNIFRVGIYSDVRALWHPEGDGIALTIELTEIPVVEGITIRGGGPLTRQEILNAARLDRDLRFDEGREALVDSLLRDYYRRRGYNAAEVQIYSMRNLDTDGVRLEIAVEPGEPTLLSKIILSGYPEFSLEQIAEMFKGTGIGRQFIEERLRDDIRRLHRFYLANSYLTADIVRAEAKYDPEKNEVELELEINAGPLIETLFDPSDPQEDRWLSLIPFQDRRVPLQRIMDNGRLRILRQLKTEGYVDTKVRAGVRFDEETGMPQFNPSTGAIIIDVNIDRGKAVHVGGLRLEGLSDELKWQLLPQLSLSKKGWFSRPPFSEEALEEDIKRVKQFLRNNGYSDPILSKREVLRNELGDRADINLEFDPGPRSLVRQVNFVGASEAAEAELKNEVPLKKGEPITTLTLDGALNTIRSYYDSRGFAEADVDYTTRRNGKETEIDFQINERQRSVVKKVIVAGNDLTSESVIRRALRLDEGDPFSRRLLSDSKRMLYRLGIFNRVQISEVDEALEPTERRLVVRVDEAAPYSVLYGFGVDSEEKFRFSFGFSNTNVAGRSIETGFNTRISQRLQRYQLFFRTPRLVRGFRDNAVRLFYEEVRKEGFKQRIDGLVVELLGLTWRGWEVTGGYQFKWINNTFETEPGFFVGRFDEAVRLSIVSAVLTRDKRDDLLEPREGYFANLIAHYSPGKWLGSEAGYFKGQFQLFSYSRIIPGTVLATAFRLGLADSFSGTEFLPISERFFAGGSSSLRGFGLDMVGPMEEVAVLVEKGRFETKLIPIGGEAMLIGNVEIRFPLIPSLGGVVFYDFGNVFSRVQEINLGDFTHSLGIGLRYGTPIGPLRVDYGKSLRSKDHRLFLSVGHAF